MKFVLREGHEVRGLMIRLYPTAEQEDALRTLESDLRARWNWLVKQTEEVIAARRAYALRNGLVPAAPTAPDCDGLPPQETKDAWAAFGDACREWAGLVHAATDKVPCCAWRPSLREEIARFGFKHDYQLFGSDVFEHAEGLRPGAHAYQALVHNYFSGRAKGGKGRAVNQRRKKFRRARDPMPLQVRSGDCFALGEFGERGKGGRNFYDCQVSFNGLKIRGRLPGRAPWGRVLQGVSITKQADGWWASIKQEVPVRVLPSPVPGSVVGIDAGLGVIAAMSDGVLVRNPREREYSERIAGRQAQDKPVGRLQQQASRHVRHLLYNDVVKALEGVEVIKVERLNGRIGQMGGSRKTSSMRTMVLMLKDRYGARVVEVDPAYTSQDCSACGHRDKEAWSFASGPICTCPACGLRMDRDINAARNIAARPGLASGEVAAETRTPLAAAKKTRKCKRTTAGEVAFVDGGMV